MVYYIIFLFTHLKLFLWLCGLCGSGQRFVPSAPGSFDAHRGHHIQYIQNNVCTKQKNLEEKQGQKQEVVVIIQKMHPCPIFYSKYLQTPDEVLFKLAS